MSDTGSDLLDLKRLNAAGRPFRIGGLSVGGEAWWIWNNRDVFQKWLLVAATDEAAQDLADDLRAIHSGFNPDQRADPSVGCFSDPEPGERTVALSRWRAGKARFLVASAEALKDPLPSPKDLDGSQRFLKPGDRLDRSLFLAHLSQCGYQRTDTVEAVGELAVRGEVLDVWSPGGAGPVRILWPMDQVESIRSVDLLTQRSGAYLDGVSILPMAPGPSGATLLDYLSDRSPDASAPSVLYQSHPSGEDVSLEGYRLLRDDLGHPDITVPFLSLPPFETVGVATSVEAVTRFTVFVQHVREWMSRGYRVTVFCQNAGEQERLKEMVLEHDHRLEKFFESGQIGLPLGPLTKGFVDPSRQRVLLSNGEVFKRPRRRLRLPKFSGGEAIADVVELKAGDFVVHERFGIGRYRGLQRVTAAGTEADYLRLEYKGGDRVFVPLFEFRQVQKYRGMEGKMPRLSSLDTASWERIKQGVQESVAALAADLLERAAKRALQTGTSFSPDSHIEKEFGNGFYYELTRDQAKAIAEVKSDMMSPRPMDRLVCGDVGYGKTEVAMRAAFKAAASNKQVAVLVPTTILAEQHGRTFADRFADYPVSVAVLSRFAKPADEKRIIQDIRRGVIDIVIGTHRLLSPDIQFKNLGLVIVDEEHRFGVRQKERMTAFRETVDVLSLSATPIPRTMASSLGGLKTLSVIETPPEGRLPVATYAGPFDEKLVRDAVAQELQRGGQVFYVFNQIRTLESKRKWLEKLVEETVDPASKPGGKGMSPVGIAHGQMTGAALEKVMWDFLHKKHAVLLATSIVESGLDIPSVNTLIVEQAEDFGLAQLYQLRGRVGRERQKAYCYLFYSPDGDLSEEARKRMTALKEFAGLGSGFRLALRDMEIRGAGNLLGPQQHGFVNAVGLDLYGQLLGDEIKRQKGEAVETRTEPDVSLELPLSAYIPPDYLPSESERIAFYRRLIDATPSEWRGLREELEDRCGKLPVPAEKLFQVAEVRHLARSRKVSHVAVFQEGLEIRFRKDAVLSEKFVAAQLERHGDSIAFLPGPPDGMRICPLPDEDLLSWTRNFLSTME
ncbi:MAG TPA: transcription-repair coupling factor [Elusimicrobiota bacterium]|nr:transcription-repair coupling factor [Elusimicrobiota bacterium]